MRKIEALVAYGLILTSAVPVMADDSANTAKPDASTSSENTGSAGSNAAGSGKRKHERGQHLGRRGTAPGKRQVMALPDLTPKQKSQLQTIYDSKKAEFANIRKQMQDLEADEWQQVQGVLTPGQVSSLSGKKASTTGSGSDDSSGKD